MSYSSFCQCRSIDSLRQTESFLRNVTGRSLRSIYEKSTRTVAPMWSSACMSHCTKWQFLSINHSRYGITFCNRDNNIDFFLFFVLQVCIYVYKFLRFYFYKEPMGGGVGQVEEPEEKDWQYPHPNSAQSVILKSVCNYVN